MIARGAASKAGTAAAGQGGDTQGTAFGFNAHTNAGAEAGANALEAQEELLDAIAMYEATRPHPGDYSGLMRAWIAAGDAAYALTLNDHFNNFILGVIILATIMVGVQTYPSVESAGWVITIDQGVLLIFAAEIAVKVFAESTRPWMYLMGPLWRWNLFDLVVVVMCLPWLDLGSGAAVLRLMRLMRMGRIINKLPKLRVLVSGLVGGFSSIAYISLLILLLLYLYAIMGYFFFGMDNDPWHFGTFGRAMVTLFRMATLEDWTEVFYVNYYGCDQFGGGIYSHSAAALRHTSHNVTFSFYHECTKPVARPVTSAIFHLTYINISALVMLSMFVGAISIAMSASIQEINNEAATKKKNKTKEGREAQHDKTFDVKAKEAVSMSVGEVNRRAKIGSMVLRAWDGQEHPYSDVMEPTPLRRNYASFAAVCSQLAWSAPFGNAIMVVIVVTGAMVGLSTVKSLESNNAFVTFENGWNWAITIVFSVECVLKIVGMGFDPLRYFKDPWNKFDFVIAVGSWVPGSGSMLKVMRLLRLLMVLKLVKSVPELRIVIEALIKGFGSIGYIGLLLLVCFYFFAILGIILFRGNDPWHFANLHLAMITLYRCATLEDWTDVMYINMYGCDKYGYEGIEELCTSPKGMGYAAAAFFIFFVMVGALVMLNLFIGVITTSMEEAKSDMDSDALVDTKLRKICSTRGLSSKTIADYRMVFDTLDTDAGGSLDIAELRTGLETAGKHLDDSQMKRLMDKVDPDGLGEVDFAEFVSFMSQAHAGQGGADEFLDEPPAPVKPAHTPLPRDELLDGIETFASHHPTSSALHMLDLLRLQKTKKMTADSVRCVFTDYLEKALKALPELDMDGEGQRLLSKIRGPENRCTPSGRAARASSGTATGEEQALEANSGAPPASRRPMRGAPPPASAQSLISKLGAGRAPSSELELRDSPMLDASTDDATMGVANRPCDTRILI